MDVIRRLTTYMISLCNIFLHLSAAITPFVALSVDQSVVQWTCKFIVSSKYLNCTISTLFFQRDDVLYLLCTRAWRVLLLRNTQRQLWHLSHCDTVNLDTVSEWWHGSKRTADQRKKHVHGVGCFEQHMWGTTISYICLLCNINKYITNIHMLLENKVTYKNVTPTYICCLKIKQHIIKSQYYSYVV